MASDDPIAAGTPVEPAVIPARTTIVAVHGNGGGSTRFAPIGSLLPDDVELVAIDLPGFNQVPFDPSMDGVADYADHLADLLADIRASPSDSGSVRSAPVLLGHGIGGSIALDLASRRPETMAGLILHAPVGADLDTRLFPRLMSARAVRGLIRRAISARPPRPLWTRILFPNGADPDDLDTFFEGYRNCEAFGHMFDIIDVDWFQGLAPVLDLPVVLLWGEHDRVLRSGQADAIGAKAPNAETVIRPGWDHFPMLEQPQEYADVVADLATRLAAPSPG